MLFSDSLTEQDIRGLAVRVDGQSLEILCRRASLTPLAVQALVDAGGARCRELLSKNRAIRQYPEVRIILENKRLESIAATALDSAPQTTPGDEMPEPQASGSTTAEETAAIETGAGQDLTSAREELVALAGRGGNLGRNPLEKPPESHAPGRPAAYRQFEPDLVSLARNKDRDGMAGRIELQCGLPARHALAILEHGGVSELTVLLKGIGITDLGAMQCLMQLQPDVARNLVAYNQAKSFLAAVDAATCRTFVEGLGAHSAPVPELARPKPAAAPVDRGALYAIASQRRQEILARAGIGPAPARASGTTSGELTKSA